MKVKQQGRAELRHFRQVAKSCILQRWRLSWCMTNASTLFRFKIDLSDIDRGVYENLEFRVAQHPSETSVYLLCKVLAYVLNFQEHLEFSPQGLGDPEAPAVRALDLNGTLALWIEIGHPNPKKLHKATKAARAVKVYTYKDPKVLINELNSQTVHKVETIEFFALKQKTLEGLATQLLRDNKWNLVQQNGVVIISSDSSGVSLAEVEISRFHP